jgi:hypothetical protein
MARKECYEKLSNFPLNLPWNGDWYLWCLFALYSDVGYLAEPMVCYREHDLNITHRLLADASAHCSSADRAMPWIIKPIAERAGFSSVALACLRSAAEQYVHASGSRADLFADDAHLEEWLNQNGATHQDKARVRQLIYEQRSAAPTNELSAQHSSAPLPT